MFDINGDQYKYIPPVFQMAKQGTTVFYLAANAVWVNDGACVLLELRRVNRQTFLIDPPCGSDLIIHDCLMTEPFPAKPWST